MFDKNKHLRVLQNRSDGFNSFEKVSNGSDFDYQSFGSQEKIPLARAKMNTGKGTLSLTKKKSDKIGSSEASKDNYSFNTATIFDEQKLSDFHQIHNISG